MHINVVSNTEEQVGNLLIGLKAMYNLAAVEGLFSTTCPDTSPPAATIHCALDGAGVYTKNKTARPIDVIGIGSRLEPSTSALPLYNCIRAQQKGLIKLLLSNKYIYVRHYRTAEALDFTIRETGILVNREAVLAPVEVVVIENRYILTKKFFHNVLY